MEKKEETSSIGEVNLKLFKDSKFKFDIGFEISILSVEEVGDLYNVRFGIFILLGNDRGSAHIADSYFSMKQSFFEDVDYVNSIKEHIVDILRQDLENLIVEKLLETSDEEEEQN